MDSKLNSEITAIANRVIAKLEQFDFGYGVNIVESSVASAIDRIATIANALALADMSGIDISELDKIELAEQFYATNVIVNLRGINSLDDVDPRFYQENVKIDKTLLRKFVDAEVADNLRKTTGGARRWQVESLVISGTIGDTTKGVADAHRENIRKIGSPEYANVRF